MNENADNLNCRCDDPECNCEGNIEQLELELEDGTRINCFIIGVFDCNDKEYVALTPQEEDSEDVFLYAFKETDEGVELIDIDDEDEFQAVSEQFAMIMEESIE